MLVFLKLVGVTNAAIWFGASVAFACSVAPAFFSSEMLRLLPVSHAGAAALIQADRHYTLQYCCGMIAVAHLLADWLYSGKSLRRWPTYLVSGLMALTLLGGLGVQPKLQRLHLEAHGVRSTPQQRARASSALKGWQAVSHLVEFTVILGLTVYVWQIAAVGINPRFGGGGKFRGLTSSVS